MCDHNALLEKRHMLLTALSMLLGMAAIASTVAFVLSRISLKKAHEAKWQEYDECGVI